MRARLAAAPVWVLGGIQGLLFGLYAILFSTAGHHRGWTERIILGVIEGAIFGIFMTRVTKRSLGAARPSPW